MSQLGFSSSMMMIETNFFFFDEFWHKPEAYLPLLTPLLKDPAIENDFPTLRLYDSIPYCVTASFPLFCLLFSSSHSKITYLIHVPGLWGDFTIISFSSKVSNNSSFSPWKHYSLPVPWCLKSIVKIFAMAKNNHWENDRGNPSLILRVDKFPFPGLPET